MQGDQTIWAFSQNFTSEFRTIRSDLERRLNDAKASPTVELLQSLSIDIAKLTKTLADATSSLPAYDQKLYETQVNVLEKALNELRTSSAPKPKFTFKRKAAAIPSSTPPADSTTPDANIPLPSDPSSQNSFISSHSYAYLTSASLADLAPASALIISDLDHCVLNLVPSGSSTQLDISAIHLHKITNSVLLLPIIKGSVLIHDISHCVIVVGCHQFRMHTSTKTDAFLWIPSNPIIEGCHDIRFATYPQTLLPSERLEESTEVSLAVQDFSHIRNTPSPNWVHLRPEDTNRSWPTEQLASRSEIEDRLRALLPA